MSNLNYIEIENRIINLSEIIYVDYSSTELHILFRNKSEVIIKCGNSGFVGVTKFTTIDYYEALTGLLKTRNLRDFIPSKYH